MNVGIELINSNIGMTFETMILVLLLIGGIIIMARSFLTGMVFLFFTTGMALISFISFDYEYTAMLVVFLISLVVLALSLYMVNKQTQGGIVA